MDAAIWSDINLKVDPEASKIALNADFPGIIMAGNVASTVLTSQEYLEELYEVKNPYTELLYKYFGTTYAFWDVSTKVFNPVVRITSKLTIMLQSQEVAMGLLIDPTLATDISTGTPHHPLLPACQTDGQIVYVDVDTSYASPNWGNLHVYQKALAPLGTRNVTYVNAIDIPRFEAMMKHAVQYPKSCATL